MDSLLAPALVCGAVGLLGGLIGTYFSIRNTKTHAERKFMALVSAWVWLGLAVFLALLFTVPTSWRWLVWILYGIILPLAVRYINRHQTALRGSPKQLNEPNN